MKFQCSNGLYKVNIIFYSTPRQTLQAWKQTLSTPPNQLSYYLICFIFQQCLLYIHAPPTLPPLGTQHRPGPIQILLPSAYPSLLLSYLQLTQRRDVLWRVYADKLDTNLTVLMMRDSDTESRKMQVKKATPFELMRHNSEFLGVCTLCMAAPEEQREEDVLVGICC